jgi:membrane fusion protein, heavy metal efflux system
MNEELKQTEQKEIIQEEKGKIIVETEGAAEVRESRVDNHTSTSKKLLSWLVVLGVILLVGVLGVWWITSKQSAAAKPENDEAAEKSEKGEAGEKEGDEESEMREIKLDAELLESANIEIEGVSSRPAVALLNVTGTVEANPQQTQAVTPLVSGRVEQVFVSIGSRVSAGQTLATINSTEIAEKYGKLREAENRLDIARKNFERVRRTENQVNVLQAKARLDEAEATLKRTRRLIELGAGAGKDLTAAEANYRTAQADYDFQRNIPLNREIAEAEAAVKTAQIETAHERQSLQALGVNVGSTAAAVATVALVPVRASVSGIVTERVIAPGSGVQAGQQLFTVSNISTVWITANVPEQQLRLINIGSAAEVRAPVLGERPINARVSYIDPGINEDTRTARVRLAIENPGERLRAGMFAEVGFQTGTSAETGEELVVPSEAIQRIGDKTVVFVPEDGEPGSFKVREVETAGETGEYTRIREGLELNEKIVTRGSFTLKTQMQKGKLGDDD